MSTAALTHPLRRPRPAAAGARSEPSPRRELVLRLVAFFALATFCAAHYAVLVAHIFPACIALVLGPLQFIPTVRARRQIHRTIGRLYLFAGVLPAALAAVPVALLSGRLVTEIGLTIPAILWLITGTLAYQAARRHDYTSHRIPKGLRTCEALTNSLKRCHDALAPNRFKHLSDLIGASAGFLPERLGSEVYL